MDLHHGALIADCIERERQECADLAAERWYLSDWQASEPRLRETLAGTLIALARWLSPQHTALSIQRQ